MIISVLFRGSVSQCKLKGASVVSSSLERALLLGLGPMVEAVPLTVVLVAFASLVMDGCH